MTTNVNDPGDVASIRAVANRVLRDSHHADPTLPEKAVWLAQAVLDLTATRAQADVDRLAVSVWGVREAHDVARALLAEYDIYPKS